MCMSVRFTISENGVVRSLRHQDASSPPGVRLEFDPAR